MKYKFHVCYHPNNIQRACKYPKMFTTFLWHQILYFPANLSPKEGKQKIQKCILCTKKDYNKIRLT